MSIRKQAAEFYEQAAKGTELESILTSQAADRMGRLFDLCARVRARRNATKGADPKQAESIVNKKDMAVIALLLAGYIVANSIAPVVNTELGNVDPDLTDAVIWIDEVEAKHGHF